MTNNVTYYLLYLCLNINFQWQYCDAIFIFHVYNQLLQQMRGDKALLTLEDGGSPIQNPSTAAEDARLASLISLDGILRQIKVFAVFKTSLVLYLIILCGMQTSSILNIY